MRGPFLTRRICTGMKVMKGMIVAAIIPSITFIPVKMLFCRPEPYVFSGTGVVVVRVEPFHQLRRIGSCRAAVLFVNYAFKVNDKRFRWGYC